MKETNTIVCSHCNYTWESKAKTMLVTCANCGKKTKGESGEATNTKPSPSSDSP